MHARKSLNLSTVNQFIIPQLPFVVITFADLVSDADKGKTNRLRTTFEQVERLHLFPRDQLNKIHDGHVGVPDKRV